MKPRRSDILAFCFAALCAAGIGLLQPAVGVKLKKIRLTDDTTALPPPRQLRAMSMGYRAALADLLWAKLLVEYGVRTEQRRTFDALPRYLDAIIELEPDHRTLYQFVDALIVFKPGAVATADDARMSRAYLERGIRERPYDYEVWLHYGQFVAFLGPSFLKSEEEIERWRKDGALAIARAVELGADADRSLAASSVLSKGGERAAAIEQLRHAYALTDNTDTRHQILLKLQHLQASADIESSVAIVEHEWRTRYPFLSRGTALLIGPRRDAALCAGPHAYAQRECPADWSAAIRDTL